MGTTLANSTEKRFFYGWLIVAVSFLALTASIPYGGGPLFGVFLQPMSSELGWTKTETMWSLSIGWIMSGLISPFLGRLVDRRGARVMMVLGAIVSGGSLLAVSRVTSLGQLYLFHGVIGASANASMGGIVATTAVANWFVGKRGRAMAIALTGYSIGNTLIPPFVIYVITAHGWRTAWVAMAVLIWALVIMPAGLLLRRRPEDMGLQPDGTNYGSHKFGEAARKTEGRGQAPLLEEVSWRPRAAFKTKAFWLITFAVTMLDLVPLTLSAHLYLFLTNTGIALAAAAAALSLRSVATIPGRFFWGLLTERISIRYCLMLFPPALALSVASFLLVSNEASAIGVAMLAGFVGSGQLVLNSVVWPSYFGRRYLGSIRGLATMFQIAGPAGGTLFAAWIYDSTGSYHWAFVALMLACVLAAVLLLLAKPPEPKEEYIVRDLL